MSAPTFDDRLAELAATAVQTQEWARMGPGELLEADDDE